MRGADGADGADGREKLGREALLLLPFADGIRGLDA